MWGEGWRAAQAPTVWGKDGEQPKHPPCGGKDRGWLKAPSFLLSLFRPWMVSSEFSIYQIRLTFRNLGGKGHVLLI